MTTSEIELVRLYTDDRDDGTHELFLEDDEVQSIVDGASNDLHTAASRIWGMKAARVHEWYTTSLDGSYLSREQVFDHCLKMAEFHKGYASGELVSTRMVNTYDYLDTETSYEL